MKMEMMQYEPINEKQNKIETLFSCIFQITEELFAS